MTDRERELSQLKRNFSMASLSTSDHLSESNYTTDSSSIGTMVGPGSLAGKAIYRLGKITLKGVEQVAIYRRLSAISFYFPHDHRDSSNVNGIEQMYLDLLELSRPGMYSNGIRFQALGMIMAQIGTRNTKYLLNALTRFPSIELGHLVADIIPHFDPVSLTSMSHADVVKDPILKAYVESLSVRVENSFVPFIDFLSQIVTLDEDRRDVVLANGVLDMMLGLYVTDFQDVLAPRDFPRSTMKSSLLGACNSLFMGVLLKGSGLELISKHGLSILWPFHPALEFLADTERRRFKRGRYWDVMSRDYVQWRVRTIQNMMFDFSCVFDVDTFLDTVIDCLTFVMSPDEEISYRGLRCLYTAIGRDNVPFSVATAVHSYLSKGEGFDVASMLKSVAKVLLGLLSPTPRVVESFTFDNDPSDLIPDVLATFINFFASLARRSEKYHKLITETGIIRIGRETLTILENAKLENEEPTAIAGLMCYSRKDLELYSSTYKTTADQPYQVHVVRWDLIVLEKWAPGRKLLLCPPGRWAKGGPVYGTISNHRQEFQLGH
ncbi:hypothetical protein E1B28_004888 [Marasmius oreades]|uniref:Uncharacterized protein n=1 Tax=Marasmius oreades TaxID=181124 RepID=A0A9P7UZQ6_9AGAR|nr:uncharacterized protein E1B28_004888 [Marasmius oreades]KAG7097550.1 hypothetical protein E1B28_004888 [Marasmius oreades]